MGIGIGAIRIGAGIIYAKPCIVKSIGFAQGAGGTPAAGQVVFNNNGTDTFWILTNKDAAAYTGDKHRFGDGGVRCANDLRATVVGIDPSVIIFAEIEPAG
jgi:hypothetical protein